jgi:hypothetical protein
MYDMRQSEAEHTEDWKRMEQINRDAYRRKVEGWWHDSFQAMKD